MRLSQILYGQFFILVDTKEPHLSRMIRSDNWKFIYYHGYNNQLFNLKNDPDEMNNLSGLKEYSKIETKLLIKY